MPLGAGFQVLETQARPSVILFLLPDDVAVKLLALSSAPCLSACHHVSCHDNHRLTLPNYKPVPIRVAVVMVSLHSNRNPNYKISPHPTLYGWALELGPGIVGKCLVCTLSPWNFVFLYVSRPMPSGSLMS